MVGIDLLEIDRLERALARRPRLAERLFTEEERAYASTRARPGQHLAARFCAKEAVAKALGAGGLGRTTSRSSSGRRAPRVRAQRAAPPSAPAELGVEVGHLAHALAQTAAAVAVAAVSLPPLDGAAARRRADARDRPLGDRGARRSRRWT